MMRYIKIAVLLALIPFVALAYPPVEEVTSKSGVKAWLIEVHELPIINIDIVFRDAGYGHDPAGKEGLASIVSDMLKEGSGTRSAQKFSADEDRNAISISTDADTHDFSIHLKTLSRNRELAISMLKDMLQKATLPESSLERLKPQYAVSRKRLFESGEFMASWQWHQMSYPNHPYSTTGIGSDESVASITTDDIKKFIASNFTRGNVVISVAGDIGAPALADVIDNVFGSLPEKQPEFKPIPKIEMAESGLQKFAMENSQSEVFFGLPGIERKDPDFYAMYVLNEILGGSGFMSVLTDKIRNQNGLVYSISTSLDTSRASPILSGNFGSRTGQETDAIGMIISTIDKMKKGEITETQVQDAKTSLIGALPLNTDTTAKLTGYLRLMQLDDLGMDYLEKRRGYFEAITYEDVKRVAAKYLDTSKMLIVVAGK